MFWSLGVPRPVQHALVHQRHAMASFGFVRYGVATTTVDHRPRIEGAHPEFRRESGSHHWSAVEQQHTRLGCRAQRGELFLMPPLRPSGGRSKRMSNISDSRSRGSRSPLGGTLRSRRHPDVF
jgi:hypothetical protein